MWHTLAVALLMLQWPVGGATHHLQAICDCTYRDHIFTHVCIGNTEAGLVNGLKNT